MFDEELGLLFDRAKCSDLISRGCGKGVDRGMPTLSARRLRSWIGERQLTTIPSFSAAKALILARQDRDAAMSWQSAETLPACRSNPLATGGKKPSGNIPSETRDSNFGGPLDEFFRFVS